MRVSSDGIESVDSIRQLRSKLHNDNFRVETDRLTEILQMDSPPPILWHKNSRSNYMSKSKIQRLQNASLKETDSQSSSTSTPTVNNLRSKIPAIDWKQCIFCQKDKKESLHLIQESKVSTRILEAAKYDQSLRI